MTYHRTASTVEPTFCNDTTDRAFGNVGSFVHRCLVIALLMLSGQPCVAADADDNAFFESKIRPVLVEHCYRCHAQDAKKIRGGLVLDSREGLRRGGESGPGVVPHQADESLLLQAIRHESFEMPPDQKLPDAVIRDFEQWIADGAFDPRDGKPLPDSVATIDWEAGRQFWAFRPLSERAPPTIHSEQAESLSAEAAPLSTIDKYILAKLQEHGIEQAGTAERATLIRRAYFALVGLPPSPQQIDEFLNDPAPDDVAFGRIVDGLLESPHFGERWGRHWLDVVRFAESSGGGRTLLFPEAWRYRDYVIESFNRDLPYDQFIKEQVAGDMMHASDWQERRRQLVATAFLLLGPTNYELQDKDQLEMDVVDEQLDTLGKAFLGMTIGCARCHDHKFDPIPMTDYYAMAGIMMSTKSVIHSNVSTWNLSNLPVDADEDNKLREHEGMLEQLKQRLKKMRERLDELEPASAKDTIDVSSLSGIVVDDRKARKEGVWAKSKSTKGYVGVGYLHDRNEDAIKRVTFARKLPAGSYEVRVTYTPGGNRSAKVPIHVHHSDGESIIYVDQQQPGSESTTIHSLGVFSFGDADAQVVVTNEGAEPGHVIADAVIFDPQVAPASKPGPIQQAALPRADQVDIPENIAFIVPDPTALPGVVVDDTQAKLVGEWKHSVHTPPFVGVSYIHDLKEGKGEKSATFVPDLPVAGRYEVRVAHNSNVRRASGVPVTVRHADGIDVIRIDEADPAPINKLFRSVGEFSFAAGREGSVTIGTDGTDGKYVIVDAVQFLPVGDTEQEFAQVAKQARPQETPKSQSSPQDSSLADAKQAKANQRLKRQLAKRIKEIETLIKERTAAGPKRPQAMAVVDRAKGQDIPLAIRGVVHNKGAIVPRGFLQIASGDEPPLIAQDQSGRMQLAEWITDVNNPLTARIMVNRIWYWLFGQGLVRTLDNFGSMGESPSHPELLDYLARQYIENGWSTKRLIREIMLSRVYRLTSGTSDEATAADPDNRWYGRMNRQRLDAESIRDSLLQVSGQLNRTMGGANIKKGTTIEYNYVFDSPRRSVYLPVFRNALPEIFETFDFADPNIQNGKRTTSTIAPQALLLMNHPRVIQQCKLAAERTLGDNTLAGSKRIERAYLEVLGRVPDEQELRVASSFVGNSEDPDRWAMLFQALFQTLDFRYVN